MLEPAWLAKKALQKVPQITDSPSLLVSVTEAVPVVSLADGQCVPGGRKGEGEREVEMHVWSASAWRGSLGTQAPVTLTPRLVL